VPVVCDSALRVVMATAADLDRYLDLLEELAEWLHGRGIEQWPRGLARRGRDYYQTSIEKGELHVAFVGDQFAGGLRLLKRDPIVWPEVTADDALYVYTLAIRRSFSGRGLGRQLLAWAERQAVAHNRRYLRLDCVRGNVFLHRYYERAGFTPRGAIDAAYPGLPAPLPLNRYEKAVAASATSY
jgi:GNAT superfamily N-acetyltransferase